MNPGGVAHESCSPPHLTVASWRSDGPNWVQVHDHPFASQGVGREVGESGSNTL